MKHLFRIIAAAIGLFVSGSIAEAQTTNINWGLVSGAEPRALCVYDTQHVCVTVGNLNSTTNAFTLSGGVIPSVSSITFNGATSGTTLLQPTAIASGTLTLPAATDTLVGRSTTDTLTNKTLVAPVLGAATATSINKVALTAPATGSTLTIADGKTLTASNTLTLTGTDSSSIAFGAGGTVAYTANNLSVFASTTSSQLAGIISDETGTAGNLVFSGSPTLTTPLIASISGGSATSSTLTLQSTTGSGATDAIIFKTGSQVEALRILTSGVLKTGAASFTANGTAGTPSFTNLLPTGGHTTIQEWFTVQDSAGTVRYIPAY